MSGTTIDLPRTFNGQAMTKVVSDLVKSAPGNKLPDQVTFNFDGLSFIRPAGVTFLNNLVRWLQAKGSKVKFGGLDDRHQAIAYLDDSLFFNTILVRPSDHLRRLEAPLCR